MRVTAAFNRLLALPGTTVRHVLFQPARITVTVALRRHRLACADCSYSTRARYDTRTVESSWRHLDLGRWRLIIRARLRRIDCRDHGVRSEQVPFARVESGFTRDFEDLVAWLATRMDKTAVTRLVRIAWQTVAAVCQRGVADELDPGRLEALFEIGIDEVSWRKQHRYLTLVTDHRSGKVVGGPQGKDTATCDRLFAELGTDRAAKLTAISTDLGPAFLKVGGQAGPRSPGDRVHRSVPCGGPGDRRAGHRPPAGLEPAPRGRPGPGQAVQGARWVLLKRPERLTEEQTVTLRALRRQGGQPGAPMGSRRRCGRCSPATLPQARRRSCLTAGAPWPAVAAWTRSSPRRHDPQAPPRHPGCDPPWDQQRSGRGTQQQGPAHHPPRVRVPFRPGCACADNARVWPDCPPAPARPNTCSPTFSLIEP